MKNGIFTGKNIITLLCIILVIIIFSIAFLITYRLKIAHSTFENYAAFKGCTVISVRTLTSGECILPTGENIKIIKSENGKWYVNGDLSFP